MDGGTQGIYLVQHVQAANILVVFDAIDYGLAGGEMKIIQDEQVPHFMGAKKVSLHQTGFQEVLSMSQLLGDYPDHISLFGVQPVELEDFGGSLRPAVKARIQPAIDHAIEYLQGLGIPAYRRSTPLSAADHLSPPELELDAYETQRPSEQEAWRIGDQRVLQDEAVAFDPKPLDLGPTPRSINVDSRRPD
ncbi:unnamed protein product [Cyprideis torosa]|uniref:Uncharacterized protein n=1 Tax=Cyprideis torosa TaxID=163714 RepID=A0A7R8WWS4_9CRUS|nr:unnamed protein product [Cyprideis torosa]CAG0910562.1 unnamed protein product [Cyprideis torosa]